MKPGRTWPLLPLTPLYAAAQALDHWSYARAWRRVERLRWPVVSVGNLSVGGAGKTPFVIALTRLLSERGGAVDVLSGGYGRTSQTVERVVAGTDDPSAAYGDEPWLIAESTGVPVFVGRERAAAGRLAEETLLSQPGARHVHLLDDGMQHRRLARDVEIVLLHPSDFTTTLLPAGRLREPLAALERADVVVLREEDGALELRARRWMRKDASLWIIRRDVQVPALPGAAVVFSAIAHPEEFVAGLRKAGVQIAATESWRDHHRYDRGDLERLKRIASQQGARCFLTTEKDIARLCAAQRAELESCAPIVVARLRVTILDEARALADLETRLHSANETPRSEGRRRL